MTVTVVAILSFVRSAVVCRSGQKRELGDRTRRSGCKIPKILPLSGDLPPRVAKANLFSLSRCQPKKRLLVVRN
jgi:hypothetical protein